MRLREWVKSRGKGEIARLAKVTRIHYTTIHKLANDVNPARYATAARVSAATGGAVSVAELCELPDTRSTRNTRSARRKRSKGKSYAQPKLAAASP